MQDDYYEFRVHLITKRIIRLELIDDVKIMIFLNSRGRTANKEALQGKVIWMVRVAAVLRIFHIHIIAAAACSNDLGSSCVHAFTIVSLVLLEPFMDMQDKSDSRACGCHSSIGMLYVRTCAINIIWAVLVC